MNNYVMGEWVCGTLLQGGHAYVCNETSNDSHYI